MRDVLVYPPQGCLHAITASKSLYVARSGRSLQLQERRARVAESNIRMHWGCASGSVPNPRSSKGAQTPDSLFLLSAFSLDSVRLTKQSLHKEREFNIFELLREENSLQVH